MPCYRIRYKLKQGNIIQKSFIQKRIPKQKFHSTVLNIKKQVSKFGIDSVNLTKILNYSALFDIFNALRDALASIALIASATRFASIRAVPAPKMPTVSRVKVLFFFYLFPMAIDEPPFDFITDVIRFLFLNHAELHARFIFHQSCFFLPRSRLCFLRTRPANNAIVATELTSTFYFLPPIKIF